LEHTTLVISGAHTHALSKHSPTKDTASLRVRTPAAVTSCINLIDITLRRERRANSKNKQQGKSRICRNFLLLPIYDGKFPAFMLGSAPK
jgi:hypothetical protein